jgi:hypothetical protein
MTNAMRTVTRGYSPKVMNTQAYDADMEPYLSLFQKPLANKKSVFSKQELEVMCQDPLHSPRLIRYLIDFVKKM